MDLRRRAARAADRSWLDALRRAVYADLFDATWGGWDEARHRRQFAASWERGGMEIVEVGGSPVGMIQLRETDHGAEVCEIQIVPEHQGRGLGTRLLRDVVDRARAHGRAVTLSTGLRNRGAYRLFTRLGFEETERSATHVHMRLDIA